MGYTESDQAAESGAFVRLKDDGEAVVLLLMVEPEPVLKAGFRGQKARRYYFPVLMDGSPAILDASKQAYLEIADKTARKIPAKITLTRRGRAGNSKTTYEAKAEKPTKSDDQLTADGDLVKACRELLSDDTIPF